MHGAPIRVTLVSLSPDRPTLAARAVQGWAEEHRDHVHPASDRLALVAPLAPAPAANDPRAIWTPADAPVCLVCLAWDERTRGLRLAPPPDAMACAEHTNRLDTWHAVQATLNLPTLE